MAAKMCLHRVMKSAGPGDIASHGHDAIQLAADIAMQYTLSGNVDEAAELLRFAASWARGELDVRAKARSRDKAVSEPKQVRQERVDPSKGELTATVGRFEDDVTRIYRPGQTRTASGTVITHTVIRSRPGTDGIS